MAWLPTSVEPRTEAPAAIRVSMTVLVVAPGDHATGTRFHPTR